MCGLPRLIFASLLAISLNVAAEESPTLERIAQRASIHLGYREAAEPFTYQPAGQGSPIGYTWEVCSHLVGAIETRLGKKLKVVPIAVTENARVMLLKTGVVDLDCGGAVNSVARQKQVAFSLTLYVNEARVMVKNSAAIASFDQLAGKRVVVLAGGIAERQVKQAALSGNITLQYQLANSPAEAMAAFVKGEVDAYIGEGATLAVQRAGSADYRLLDEALAAEPWAVMLPYGDPAAKQLVDETLRDLMQSGELARIYDKWFAGPIPPNNARLELPMSSLLKTAIQYPNDKPVN
jgi:glutamate/aspartate transport system substrate-binding protein